VRTALSLFAFRRYVRARAGGRALDAGCWRVVVRALGGVR
jgi:hypothetical protein